MAAKKYKLTYFNARAVGEPIRYLFTVAGVEYEDNRIDMEVWSQLKPSTPFGQIPLLEVDGQKLCQSRAICRYLATEFDLLADSTWDNGRIDMFVDCVDDLRFHVPKIVRAPDEETRKKNIAIFQEALPGYLANLQKMLCERDDGQKYITGDKMTSGDINFAGIALFVQSAATMFKFEFPLENYPKLKALKERVEANPKIAAWIKSRPVTNL